MKIDIRDQNPVEWFTGDGKEIMMTQLLAGAEKMVDSEEKSPITCLTVIMNAVGFPYTIDVILDEERLEGVLERIMTWGIETENYESCQRVKKLQDSLKQ